MPIYVNECPACHDRNADVRPMVDSHKEIKCERCDVATFLVPQLPNVMTVALPDGTRRFDSIRKARDIEREKAEQTRATTKELLLNHYKEKQ